MEEIKLTILKTVVTVLTAYTTFKIILLLESIIN